MTVTAHRVDTEAPPLLLVGVVVKPHALKGELVVHAHNPRSPIWGSGRALGLLPPTPESSRAPRPGEVFADTVTEAPLRELWVERARPTPDGRFICVFRGIGDRAAAEALIHHRLAIPMDSLPPAEDDAYYHHELKGLAVVTVSGAVVGTVVGIFEGPAQDLLEVAPPAKDADTFFVPFIAPIVVDVDRAGRRVTIDPPEGLLPEGPSP